ncbi:hypothetical protein DLD82_09320 [Methanospirillum stamsii]|uniref:Uncharacterized protein n=1 Tax=Methanospirillum stamsii TaxID=1277351 RepID=A0A2V2NCW4_9EURY|nr:hypothetical protein DLD82_09320 [Methanospirillum stamsii]
MYIDQFLPGQKYHELKSRPLPLIFWITTCFRSMICIPVYIHDSKHDIGLSDALEIHFLNSLKFIGTGNIPEKSKRMNRIIQ